MDKYGLINVGMELLHEYVSYQQQMLPYVLDQDRILSEEQNRIYVNLSRMHNHLDLIRLI